MGEEGAGGRVEGAPAWVPSGEPGAGGSVAPPGAASLRFGSAAFSVFRSPWSAWVTLFLFLEDWSDPTQEESHHAVAIVFHYLKIGGKRSQPPHHHHHLDWRIYFLLLLLLFFNLESCAFLQSGFCVGLAHPCAEAPPHP